jgi:uncharacterized protein
VSATDIFKAIGDGNIDAIKELLNRDRSLADAKNESGVSALMFSLYVGRKEIADQLLTARSAVDIFEAAALGDEKALRKQIDQNRSQISSYSADGFTPLHLACFFGRISTGKILVDAGADLNANSKNGANLRPINSAAACRDLDAAYQMVSALLSGGADISAKQNGGFTALHSAAANGNVPLVKLLIERGADPHVLSDDKKTPLQFAQERNRTEIVELLSSISL